MGRGRSEHRALQDLCVQGQAGQSSPEVCAPVIP
jgi:hypothetical protein